MAQRQSAEQAHREVLRRLVAAEETERGRVSRELHDRLGQDLTALKLGLQIIRKQGVRPPTLGALRAAVAYGLGRKSGSG